jgi:hypothetical protein
MKIGILGTDIFVQGKANLADERVKTLKAMFNAPKEVYIQADIIIDQEDNRPGRREAGFDRPRYGVCGNQA